MRQKLAALARALLPVLRPFAVARGRERMRQKAEVIAAVFATLRAKETPRETADAHEVRGNVLPSRNVAMWPSVRSPVKGRGRTVRVVGSHG